MKLELFRTTFKKLMMKALRRASVEDLMGSFTKIAARLDELADMEEAKAKRMNKRADDYREKAVVATIMAGNAEAKSRKLKEVFGLS